MQVAAWGPFCLYSLDKIQLLTIMPSYISRLEFQVVSVQHTISKYRSLVHLCPHILVPFSCGTKSQLVSCFIFTWPEKLHPFLSAIYLDLVSYLMEPTGTGQVNVTCPVGKCSACLRRLAAQRPLSKGGKTVMRAVSLHFSGYVIWSILYDGLRSYLIDPMNLQPTKTRPDSIPNITDCLDGRLWPWAQLIFTH
jgi:hypothetical protein